MRPAVAFPLLGAAGLVTFFRLGGTASPRIGGRRSSAGPAAHSQLSGQGMTRGYLPFPDGCEQQATSRHDLGTRQPPAQPGGHAAARLQSSSRPRVITSAWCAALTGRLP
jgi:hypothetical protein